MCCGQISPISHHRGICSEGKKKKKLKGWDFSGFMQLMMHTENTAERKCQKEELIELHQSACASLTQRGFLSIQVLSKPLHRARGSHLA